MRMTGSVLLLASLALSACGGGAAEEEEVTSGEGMDVADVAAEMEDAVRPMPGQYQSTVEILDLSVPGMPQEQAEQMRMMMGQQGGGQNTFCLTPEEAEQGPERMVQEMTEANCEFDSFEHSAGSISADMRCTAEGGMEGAYRLDGQMDAESSTMTMQVDQLIPGVPGDGRVQIEMRVTSQRIGECA